MIVITGASRGIGYFLMNKFINEGADVIGLFNQTLPKENITPMFKVDVTNLEEINHFVKFQNEKLNHIILINCAGSNYNAFAHKADPLKWAQLVSINLFGTFNIINALLPLMREQNYGRIINFSSIVAQSGITGTSAYAASKSGLWGMTKAIAIENASKGITINNLNLGYFDIGMIKDVPTEMQDIIQAKIPSKKFGNPDEIFKAIKYLSEAEYITGTSNDINGGLY
jgi:acetoacetyl-CoA reductase/3-oxoacyl-[acyl-carrier protein] reductase